MPKVTILVSVYNAEQYVGKCLDSLLAQTLADIQVICVDDASTDGSLQTLNDYASRDNRIVVLHLDTNVGPGKARNEALKLAEGEYTCFLDSDDWLECDALEKAVAVFEAHEKTDCVLFECRYVFTDGRPSYAYPMPEFEVKSGHEAFIDSLTWKIHGVYMVRTTIHKQYPYDDTTRTYSDDNTTRVHYYVSREVRQCSGVYNYLQRDGSVTHVADTSRLNYLRANESMRHTLISLGCDDTTLRIYEQQRWLNLVDTYYFYVKNRSKLSPQERTAFLEVMRRYWQQINYSQRKFGYSHLTSWHLFRLQEETYFLLRRIHNRKTV